MSRNLKIVDNELCELPCVDDAVDSVTVSGFPDQVFDEEKFLTFLNNIVGKEKIIYVYVDYSSHLKNCEFLKCFPGAQSLVLNSKSVKSIEGIRHARDLTKLFVETGPKNRVDFNDEILQSKIIYLRLQGARKGDLEIIGKCQSIRRIELIGGEGSDFSGLKNMQLQELVLIKNRMREIGDIDIIQHIDKLWVTGCRELTGFVLDSVKLHDVTIESCSMFDAASLHHLKKVRAINIMDCKAPIILDSLCGISELRNLTITNCTVITKNRPLLGAKNLEKLFISPAKEKMIYQLSEVLKGVLVYNGDCLYVDGYKQPDTQAFYE